MTDSSSGSSVPSVTKRWAVVRLDQWRSSELTSSLLSHALVILSNVTSKWISFRLGKKRTWLSTAAASGAPVLDCKPNSAAKEVF